MSFLEFSIKTKTDFKNWIFLQLGYPIHNPELKEEHLEMCINDALEEYSEYAFQDEKFYSVKLCEYVEDVGYQMPKDVQAISQIYDYGVNGNSNNGINPFSMQYLMSASGFVPGLLNNKGGSGWLDYHMVMQWLDLTYQMTGKGFDFNYNPRTKMLVLTPDPVKRWKLENSNPNAVDQFVIICACYCLRPEEQTYGEVWVKRMGLAKAKILIGNIRTQYDGINLPGGARINGDKILAQGEKEQDSLREELITRFPAINMWVG